MGYCSQFRIAHHGTTFDLWNTLLKMSRKKNEYQNDEVHAHWWVPILIDLILIHELNLYWCWGLCDHSWVTMLIELLAAHRLNFSYGKKKLNIKMLKYVSMGVQVKNSG